MECRRAIAHTKINIKKKENKMNRHKMLHGGWVVDVRRCGWDEDIQKAYEQLNLLPGTKYEPIAQVAKQVVAGLNYITVGEQTIKGTPKKNQVCISFWSQVDKERTTSILSIIPIKDGEPVTLPDGQVVDWAMYDKA